MPVIPATTSSIIVTRCRCKKRATSDSGIPTSTVKATRGALAFHLQVICNKQRSMSMRNIHCSWLEIIMATKSRKRVFCPHCNDYISRSLYYQHRHLYYDEDRSIWCGNADSDDNNLQDVSFEFSPSNSPVGGSSQVEGNNL